MRAEIVEKVGLGKCQGDIWTENETEIEKKWWWE